MYDTEELWLSTLNLGEKLPGLTCGIADMRDRSAEGGHVGMARFWANIADVLASANDHYQKSLKDFQNDYLDDHIRVIDDNGQDNR